MTGKSCSKGALRRKRQFQQKVIVYLGVYCEGVSSLVIFESDTLDHDQDIKEVLPVALKYANDMFGDDWIFQQDGAKANIHEKWQESCANNFPSFIDKDHWPPNSSNSITVFATKSHKWNIWISKKTRVVPLKRAVKEDFVFESCLSWTNRLYWMSQDKRNSLQ